MTAYAEPMPSVMFGSPGDWDDWFWNLYHGVWMEILHAACPPDGQELWISGECERRGLRRTL